MKRLIVILFAIFFISSFLLPVVLAQNEQSTVCAVYFTGVGCQYCAKTDPIVLVNLLKKNPNLVVIEYEIYQQPVNAPLLFEYDSEYNSGLGIPLIIFDKDNCLIGGTPIIKNIREIIDKSGSNNCSLTDGSSVGFNNLHLTFLPGQPKIWKSERILSKISDGGDNKVLKKLLVIHNISSVLEEINYEIIEARPVPL